MSANKSAQKSQTFRLQVLMQEHTAPNAVLTRTDTATTLQGKRLRYNGTMCQSR